MATVVAVLPRTGTLGQVVTYNGYNYQWTGVGWKNIGISTLSVPGAGGNASSTTITSNGVSTGNTALTANGLSTGNTALTSDGVSTGNTALTANGLSTGNTSITSNGLSTGNTSITANGLSTGNTSVSDTGVNVGNVSLSNTGVNVGNVSLSNTGVNVGNVSLSNTGVNVGNVSLSNTGVNVGNVSLSDTGVNVGNVTLSNTGVNVGNVSLSDTGVNVGNVSLSDTGVSVGNVSLNDAGVSVGTVTLSNIGVNVGNVSLSDTGVNVGNVTLSNTGVNVGNVTLSNTGVNVGNVTLSNTGVNVGDVALSNTGVNVGNVSLSNAGVNVGNVSLSNTGVNVGNVSLSNSGVNVGDVALSNTGVNVGNVSLSNAGVNVGNVSLSNAGVNVGNVSLSNTGVNVGNVSLSNTGVNVGNVTLSNTGVNVGNVSLSNSGLTTGNTTVSGEQITTSNITITNTINANIIIATLFSGNGSGLYNINGANVSEVPNANYATYSLYTLDANLANLANSAITVTGSSQPNITSVGDLGGLVVLGSSNLSNVETDILTSNSIVSNSTLYVAGDATIVGNLIVYGTAIYADVTSLIVQDPIIEQGGLANGVPLPGNDGFDRGQVLHYYSDAVGAPVDAFMGWKNLAGEFAFVSNASLVNNSITIHSYGNIHGGVFIGDAYGLSNIPASNINGTVNNANYSAYSGNADTASNVTGNAQPNITSLGTLTSANISGTLVGNTINANVINTDILNANTYYGNFSGNIVLGAGNTQALFNDNGIIGSSTNFTFDKTTNALTVNGNLTSANANLGNLVTASYFSGDGSLLSNINGSNVIGEIANSNYSAYSGNANIANTVLTVTGNDQPNITSLGTLVNLTVSGNTSGNIINATYFVGDGSNITNILGTSVTGQVANANYAVYAGSTETSNIANTVTASAQPNITSIGSLTSLDVLGNVSANVVVANYIYGDAGNITNVPGANVIGTIANANYAVYAGSTETSNIANTVTASAQPNITSVGNLINLTVDDNVTANYFLGDGSNLSNINGSNVSNVDNANYANYAGNAITANNANTVTNNAQPNITSVGNLVNLTVVGNISADFLNASQIAGEAGNISNVQASNVVGTVSAATIANTVTDNAQPNITSVGNLTSLTVIGNASSNNLSVTNTIQAQDVNISGNLAVSGNVTYINVNSLQVQDPIIQLGGGANGAPLTVNDGKDRGTLLQYYTTEPVSGFIGWDNSNAEFTIASNVVVVDDVIGVQQLGNIRAQNFIGNFNGNITGNIVISGGNTEVLYNNDGVIGSSPAFTFLPDNNELNVVGTINASNISATNIVATNITGTLTGSATTAGTVTTGIQPNITAVGTLTALDITGNLTAGNANLGNLVIATFLEGTLTSSSQPNITTVGALSNLTVTGNLTAGNANLGNLAIANYFSGDGSLLTDLNGSNITEVANANYATFAGTTFEAELANVANTVSDNAQPNITSVGLLTSLSVGGMLTSFDAVLGNNASANFFNGDGGNISNVQSTNIIGIVANANYSAYAGNTQSANTVIDNAQPNITSVGTLISLNISGSIDSANANLGNVATANFFIGDGSLLSNIATGEFANYANYAGNAVIAETADVANTVASSSQPNITSLGALTELLVVGNIVAGNIDAGNVVVANYLIGDGSYISNIQGSVVTGWVGQANYSNYAGNAITAQTALNAITANTATVAINVTASSQSNITSVGTLTGLDVTGNITANIGEFGGNVAAVYFLGDGGYLSNLTGANVQGVVSLANSAEYSNIANISTTSTYANIVVDASQPNINSLGILTSLDVTGLSDLGDVTATNIVVGNVIITTSNVTADNFLGNFSGNIVSPGSNTDIIFNDNGALNASTGFQFDKVTNTATISGTLVVADSITRDGKEVPTYTSSSVLPMNPMAGDEWYDELNDRIYKYVYDGLTYAWIDISSGFISSNISAIANTIVLRDANGNIYANHIGGTSLEISGVSNLGNAGNVIITGGTVNYVLRTDGTGNLSWVDPGAQGVGGSNTQVQYNNNGTFAGSANFTYDYLTETLAANVITASGNLTSTTGNLILSTSEVSVNGTSANIFSTTITDANLGLAANVTIGSTTGNTTARGNLVANNISTSGNLVVNSLATITNLKVNDLYSNRTPISVTNDTIVDSFPVNKYRSAKYTMRVNSDDGYQAVEVLLIHNGVNSYVTIYGSLSTIGTDIISLGTSISSGNVRLLATSTIANTTVNLLGTYVAD